MGGGTNNVAWIKYAQFEASHNEFDRARSVYERALEVDSRAPDVWVSLIPNGKHTNVQLKYTDMELKARNINHARNLFDRAVTLLPRVDAVSVRRVTRLTCSCGTNTSI